MILDDEYALKSGADARDMDEEAYSLYLEEAMLRDSYKAAAKKLTEDRKEYYEDYEEEEAEEEIDDDFIEITQEELAEDPSLMLTNRDALAAGASVMGMTVTEYKAHIEELIDSKKVVEETDSEEEPTDLFSIALSAAAKELDMESTDLSENLIWMKEEGAIQAQMDATGANREQLNTMINQAMASQALSSDESVDFDIEAYLWLNVGCFLLILAFSSIGFFASCLFNRTNQAMVIGGGLPFIFFLFNLMQKMGENLENFKYFTITTLYDTSAIIAMEDFGAGLMILAIISVVLYAAGSAIFCKKDLPL